MRLVNAMNSPAPTPLPGRRHRSITNAATGGSGQLRGKSRGIALITSMIILGVLALLGVATMSATNTELQIAANLEQSSRSFHAAEAGINAARMPVFANRGIGPIIFSSVTPNPLAGLDGDTPTVAVEASGDPMGQCERSETASSADVIACGAFDLRSEHAPASSDAARNAAATVLRLGISRQFIAQN